MKRITTIACSLLTLAIAMNAPSAFAEDKPVLDVTMKNIDGKEVNLADQYKGKVVLAVNVASQCGLTPQYEAMQELHQKFGKEGLAVVGFPCNQFGAQEPGTETQILQFCKDNYDVKFDLFSKIEVNGENNCELYKRLTGEGAKFPGKITWNFEKFLISREGQVVARFAPRTAPDDPQVIRAIQQELAKK
jgi:glutathione peroxidase